MSSLGYLTRIEVCDLAAKNAKGREESNHEYHHPSLSFSFHDVTPRQVGLAGGEHGDVAWIRLAGRKFSV